MLRQTATFKPKINDKRISNLSYCGHFTVPGPAYLINYIWRNCFKNFGEKAVYDILSQSIYSVMYEYSISFYLSTFLLSKRNRHVDSFHEYNKEELLDEFEDEFNKSIENKISINPIINFSKGLSRLPKLIMN